MSTTPTLKIMSETETEAGTELTSTDFEQVAARYAAMSWQTPPRDRAVCLKELLDAATALVPRGANARKWLAKKLSISNGIVDNYLGLLAFGRVAQPLWERASADMPMETALRLMREARDRADAEKTGVQSAIERCLAEYDALPHISRLPDGKIVRKKSSVAMSREASKSPPPRRRAPKDVAAMGGEPEHDVRGFRTTLRTVISDHFRAHLQGLDPMAVEMAWQALESDLKVVLDAHVGKIGRMRRNQAARVVMVSRGRIIAAYKGLSMEPVGPGEPIDIKAVKRQYKRLASIYHPDKSGTEETRNAYEAVVAAYSILEEAHEQQQSNKGGTDGRQT